LSISRALTQVREIISPIDILREKLSRAEIINRQKVEFADIYALCLSSDNFEHVPNEERNEKDVKKGIKYKLIMGLLMIHSHHYKIYVPPTLIGPLLSYTHLMGHKGTKRMMLDLQSYYFDNMTSLTRKFISCCWSCFLVNKSNKQVKLGIYPSPKYPMQEINLDLAENLNTVDGYSHLLIVNCELTDYTLIFPLRSKRADHVTEVLLHSVLQAFNVQRIHSDNGPCFRSKPFLETLAACKIKVIGSAALHSAGRGHIERLVGICKTLLKKFLATRPTLEWRFLPLLVSKFFNNSVSPRTGFKPQEMVFGSTGQGDFFLNLESYVPAHYSVRNRQEEIDKLTMEIADMTAIATEYLTEQKLKINANLNKHKITKQFQKNDFVFVLDRTVVPGSSRPLKTRFHPSPYIVLSPKFTSSLLMRLADNFQAVYSNNDIKKYEHTSPLFRTLPTEVSKILLHDFRNLLESDLCTIAKYDPLSIPTGVQLFDTFEEELEDKELEQNELKDFPLPTKQDKSSINGEEISTSVQDTPEHSTTAPELGIEIDTMQNENTNLNSETPDVYNPSPLTKDDFEMEENSDSENEETELIKSETEKYSFRDRNKRKVRFQNFA
jgi:hypothetical protein